MKLWTKIMMITLLSCSFIGCSSKEVIEKEKVIYGYDAPEETKIEVENDHLKLLFNTDTTQFSVYDKDTSAIWYSNPEGAQDDPIADSGNKDGLRSTLIMEYGTSSGSTTVLNNYGYSIAKGLYEYEVLDNGIQVNYSIGNIERSYYIPVAVPESRMMEFYDKLEKKQQRQVDEYYRRYDITKLRATDDKNELLNKYPDLSTERVYVLRDSVAAYLKITLEEMFASVGYTVEDYENDLARYETKVSKEAPVFNVSIRYELVDDELLVTVPLELVSYPEDYPILELQVLPYLGAGSTEEEGYLLVPDGAGGIIHFNNGKQSQSSFYSNLYGWDYAIRREALVDESRASYGVYGIAKNDSSFITILEDGASYATIEADVSGRLHSYNYVAATYTLIHGEIMDISSKSDKVVKVYEEQLPKENLVLRYRFIDSDNYVDMAVSYREYLMEKYDSLTKIGETSLPVTVEILGATDRVKQKFGLPMTVAEPLTTYKEAKDMITYLYEGGITNLSVNYNGWFNEGVQHKVPDKISLMSELGSKKELKQLISYSNQLGITMYLQGNFEFIYKNSIVDGFLVNRDAAKFLSRKIAELRPYSSIWYGEYTYLDNKYYLAKLDYTLSLVDKFETNIMKLGTSNIAFGDVGKQLSSDLNPKKVVSRETARTSQQGKLEELYSSGSSMLFYSGNDYVLPYADQIVDMKLDSKGYLIVDEEVPFYPIALHGLVSYAGESINLAEDYNKNLLKTLETGASLYYVFMDEPVATLQESGYTEYYGTDFSMWKEDTLTLYEELQEKLKGTMSSYIINHTKLDRGVYITEYENGTKVIVNYNQEVYEYKGTIVKGKGYLIEQGDK